MGFPLAGQQGQIFFTTSFPKFSKGYDKGYGLLPRSTNHPYGSLADTEVVFRPKRFLKQAKRHEGHGRGVRNRPFLLASAAMDAEGIEFSEAADTSFATAVAKKEMANDMDSLRMALASAEARAMVAERAKSEALEALARAEAKQNEYAASLLGTLEVAVGEFLSVKLSLGEELDRILEEKLGEKGEATITKREVADLAAELEKIAGVAIQRAALRIGDEVNLRVAVAETSAAEATARVEERILEASVDAANSMITETRDAIHKSFSALDAAKDKAHKAEIALFQKMQILDDLVLKEAASLGLKQNASQMQQQLQVAKTEIERLRAELKAVEARAVAAEARAKAADAALLESQEAGNRSTREHEESARKALEALKKAGAARLDAVRATFKADIEVLEAAVRSVQMAEKAQDQAYLRRYQALESSLAAAEAAEVAWKNRAIAVEDLVRRIKEQGNEATDFAGRVEGIVNGGRIEAFLHSETRKLELLANGPRCETPEWMARRIDYALQGLPLRKDMLEQADAEAEAKVETDAEAEVVLELPSPEDVWSIASAKVKEDVFTKHAAEKAKIDEQRQALERSLERTTPKSPIPFKVAEDGTKKLESGTGSGKEVVFQGFNWESWRRKWYLELAPKAADLFNSGITTIWFPPPTQSVAPQGYMPGDLYNLNSAYGTIEELKQCVEEMHKHNLLVLGDAVLNHRCAQKKGPNGVWNVFGGKLAWGPEAIVRDDPHFQGRGNPSSGDIFHAAPNIDHSQEFVRKDIKEWLDWLRVDIGFDGWRLDFVRGFWGGYVKEYIESSQPAFAIGEYWDSLTYEGGTVAYNQDAHRQRIINWINATGGTSSAFDVTTKGILHSALHNQYWRLIDPQGKPPGVIGWWPSRAVTFLENHDTGSTQGHWPFPRDKLMQGYAYILTHPGTPLVFYDHFYDFGLHDEIAELIQARKRTGVHCRSPLKIHVANNEGYAAQVGDNLVVKLGSLDWNPSKQINIVGDWKKCVDKGGDYQIWEKA